TSTYLHVYPSLFSSLFLFTHPSPTEIYTLSLHDALPIFYLATDPDREGEAIAQETAKSLGIDPLKCQRLLFYEITPRSIKEALRSEEHTSELQSQSNLVCRLLLEKKKKKKQK